MGCYDTVCCSICAATTTQDSKTHAQRPVAILRLSHSAATCIATSLSQMPAGFREALKLERDTINNSTLTL